MLQARFHRNFRNYKKSLQYPRCSLRNILMNKHDPPKSSLALMKSNSGDFFVRSEPHTSRQHECQRSLLISRTVKCTNETGTCTLDFSVIGVLRVSNWKRFESIGWSLEWFWGQITSSTVTSCVQNSNSRHRKQFIRIDDCMKTAFKSWK